MMDFDHGCSRQEEADEEAACPPALPGDSDAPVLYPRVPVDRVPGASTGP